MQSTKRHLINYCQCLNYQILSFPSCHTSYADKFPSDKVTEYFRVEQDVQPGIQSSLSTTVEIELDEHSDKFTAYFRAYRKVGDEEVDFLTDCMGV